MTWVGRTLAQARQDWPILVPLAFALSAFRAWFGPGLIIGDDQFRFSRDVLASYFPWRSAWDGSFTFGIATADSSPTYPLWSLAGLLARIGADFSVIERLIWLWPLLLCLAVAPYALAAYIARDRWAATLAACTFAVNTWTVGLVQRGHIPSLIAYAIIPFTLLSFALLLERRRPANAVAFAALFTMQIMYDLRYAYLTAIVCAIYLASVAIRSVQSRETPRERAPAPFSALAWAIAALAAFNLYWLIPQLLAPARLPANYDSLAYYLSASSYESLAHALTLFYPFYHYVQGGAPFAVWPVEPAFIILPVLAMLAAIVARRDPWMIPLFLTAALGIVATSGPQSPFGAVNEFVFLHVPGWQLFRDASKFTSLVAFAYAGLFALGFARLSAWFSGAAGTRATAAVPVIACSLIALYAVLMRGAYDPQRGSNFAPTALTADDRAIQAYLDRDPEYFRTLLFPTWRPHIVGSERHPFVSADYLLDYSAADGGLGDLFPTPDTLFDRLASPVMSTLLAQASVRYVVVDADPTNALYEPSQFGIQYAETVAFMRSRPWLQEVTHFGQYVVFQVRVPPGPRAFFATRPLRIAGAPTALFALVGTPAWSSQSGDILTTPPDRLADGWAYAMDPSLTADGLAMTYDVDAPRAVRAWVGAGAQPMWEAPQRRARMTHADELKPSTIPDVAGIPAMPMSVEIDDPSIVSAPFADPRPIVHFVGMTSPRATIGVVNWTGSSLVADITIANAFSPDANLTVTAGIAGGAANTYALSPGGPSSAADLTLRDMRLAPGLNDLLLEARQGAPADNGGSKRFGFHLIFADDVRVAPVGGSAASVLTLPGLESKSGASTKGIDAIAVTRGGDGEGLTAFSLLSGSSIPLVAHPIITLTYQTPDGRARAALDFALRQISTGTLQELVHPLSPATSTDTIDLFSEFQTALSERAGAQPEASDYELSAIHLAIIAPRSPRTRYDFRLEDAQIGSLARRYAGVVEPFAAPTHHDIDLRAARVERGSAQSSRDDLEAACTTGTRCTIDIPVVDMNRASRLVFWTKTQSVGPLGIGLSFAPLEHRGPESTVEAGGRSIDENAGSVPAAWQADVVHVARSAATRWRRYVIDLDDVKSYRLPPGRDESLAAIHIDADASDPGAHIAVSDAALLVDAPMRSSPKSVASASQSLLIDTRVMPLAAWHADPLSGRLVAPTDSFTIAKPAGVAEVEPVLPITASTLYIEKYPPRQPAPPATTGPLEEYSPAEYAAAVQGSGLLVFPMSYAPGWRAYALHPGDSSPTGIASIDALRYRDRQLRLSNHVAVNGAFNGWQLGAGADRIVLLYEPEAISEWSALLWLALSASVVASSIAASRARP